MGLGSVLAKRVILYTASTLLLGPTGSVVGETIAELTDEL